MYKPISSRSDNKLRPIVTPTYQGPVIGRDYHWYSRLIWYCSPIARGPKLKISSVRVGVPPVPLIIITFKENILNTCKRCNKQFVPVLVVNGKKVEIYKRKHCWDCIPYGSSTHYDMYLNKYTESDFINAVKNASSYGEVLSNLNIARSGDSYKTIKKYIKLYNIDTSHFKRKTNKGKAIQKRPIEDYLSNNYTIPSTRLKKRLIKEGLMKPICSMCKQTEWMGEPIPLELHHIDKNHYNNNLDNLQLLCPNCHALTHKLQSKAKKIQRKKQIEEKERIRKRQPRPNTRKVPRPPLSQLLQDVEQLGYCGTGRKYGVSDNAIRKWIKMYQRESSYPLRTSL